ncbi:MAG TPA: branched-chain amino acid ABC transporter permease LivH [Paenalcaligenes hominis]|uniref:Branched-chain amino acid ABC transporter permease LivH n=1 Tax=Paenalcaligenes hominis TaxID=643674 RepID=A0A1U9K2C6_9BURK|nr:branched-chain amino acid ABC transporter permease LivH [Paenalcaligenes hominis]AQS52195.1 branched-chain amino acid ABC transporter permease LivH [Paenalcaligenes hominis]NJB66078.1 branched-chain amino acid transport system permease protein [Paenalcaligenes hominis]GGE75781.1 branched-chain amino acid ABC transporter permease [Paenalcaligenes hominis]HJH24179.1 branched-chain amino acid ABC transporter permease LivH [Paenalcaligenes hominis]
MDSYILGQQLINGLTLGSIYGLIAVGYTMVYGIIGMINFAHGDIYMVSAYISAITLAVISYFGIQSVPFALITTLIVTMFITGLYGWSIERTVYRPLRGTTRLAPLITAIGVSLVLQNYVQLAQGPNVQGVPTLIAGSFRLGNATEFIQIRYMSLIIIAASLIAMAVLTWIIQNTSMGRQSRATQQDRKMATMLGVNTGRVISSVFVIGSALAAIAGVLVTLNYGSFDFYVGFIIGIKAFSAAVLGGIGSLPGAMLGGLLLGVLESVFSGLVSSDYKDVFAFSILVLVLIFKPSGLLGRPAVEKV